MNKTERSFAAVMSDAGFHVIRNGWPDFLVMSPDRKDMFAVEVKYGNDELTEDQMRMHNILAQHGVRVFVVRAPCNMVCECLSCVLRLQEESRL